MTNTAVRLANRVPAAAVERRKQIILTMTGKKYRVVDSDLTKCGMIPSVALFSSTIKQSFYTGQVYVRNKDPIFEPSSTLTCG